MLATYCSDEILAYQTSRTRFRAGEGMALDESYRHAHLPLVASASPLIIPEKPGSDYRMGRHSTVYSVVMPIAADALEASPAYRELDLEMRAAPFARKIAWSILPRRRERLHATLCGGYGGEPPVIDAATRGALRSLGPISAELRGLFSGNVNKGRLYLRVYPQQRDGQNLFHGLQRALGRNLTNLYVAGIWNLTDNLDPHEAQALAAMIDRWWSRRLLRIDLGELWVLGARDDLVLDSEISERLSLG